jgi:predicted amidohydrolase
MDLMHGNPRENAEKAQSMICDAAEEKPDVILLPERWNVRKKPQINSKSTSLNPRSSR